MEDTLKCEIKEIPVAKIYVSKRMRKVIKSTEDLESTIPVVGLLHPITVKIIDDDFYKYELIAGERRLVAYQKLKETTIKANIATAEQAEKSEFIELIENEARESFTPIESVLETFMTHEKEVKKATELGKSHTIAATARMFGKSASYISGTLDIAKLYFDCSSLVEYCEANDEMDDEYYKWSKEFITSCNKGKTRADLERAFRTYNMTQNTQQLAEAIERQMEENASLIEEEKYVDPEIPITITEEEEESSMPLWKLTIIKRVVSEYKTGDTYSYLEGYQDQYASTCYWDIDPPFGINYNAMTDDKKYVDAKTFNEGCQHYRKIINEMARISGQFSRAIIWHGGEPRFGTVVQNYLKRIGWKYDPIPFLWIKPRGHTRKRDTNLPRCYESATIAFAPEASFYKSTFRHNYYQCGTPPAQERFHPNAKPYELVDFYFTRLFEFPSTAHFFIPFAGGGAAVYKALQFNPIELYTADLEAHYKNELLVSIESGVFESTKQIGDEDDL